MKLCSLFLLLVTIGNLSVAQQASTTYNAKQQLQAWRRSRASALMDDFGELSRYREANAALRAPLAGEERVVFYGDSTIDGWDLKRYFPRKQYINRGISGQTTSQLLLRFRQDVVELRPKIVVILAGTNDIAGNTGPISLSTMEGNFASMTEIARENGIRVVISSVLPVHNYTTKSEVFFPLRPMSQIEELNRWLKQHCQERGHIYIDYFSAMLNQDGYLKRELSEDGLHPNEAAYALMAPMAAKAIRNTLQTASATKKKPGH